MAMMPGRECAFARLSDQSLRRQQSVREKQNRNVPADVEKRGAALLTLSR